MTLTATQALFCSCACGCRNQLTFQNRFINQCGDCALGKHPVSRKNTSIFDGIPIKLVDPKEFDCLGPSYDVVDPGAPEGDKSSFCELTPLQPFIVPDSTLKPPLIIDPKIKANAKGPEKSQASESFMQFLIKKFEGTAPPPLHSTAETTPEEPMCFTDTELLNGLQRMLLSEHGNDIILEADGDDEDPTIGIQMDSHLTAGSGYESANLRRVLTWAIQRYRERHTCCPDPVDGD